LEVRKDFDMDVLDVEFDSFRVDEVGVVGASLQDRAFSEDCCAFGCELEDDWRVVLQPTSAEMISVSYVDAVAVSQEIYLFNIVLENDLDVV
jgi:hypothetical protein